MVTLFNRYSTIAYGELQTNEKRTPSNSVRFVFALGLLDGHSMKAWVRHDATPMLAQLLTFKAAPKRIATYSVGSAWPRCRTLLKGTRLLFTTTMVCASAIPIPWSAA